MLSERAQLIAVLRCRSCRERRAYISDISNHLTRSRCVISCKNAGQIQGAAVFSSPNVNFHAARAPATRNAIGYK